MRSAPTQALAVAVIATCAASAGAHAALVPQHLDHESRLGVAFVAATVALVAVIAALVWRPGDPGVAHAAALLLAALIGVYVMAVTTGIPGLMDGAEPVDPVALATKAVEALGVVLAFRLTTTAGARRLLIHKEART